MLEKVKIKQIYALLDDLKMKHRKEEMVGVITGQRTTHISEMANVEGNSLIRRLTDLQQDKIRPMRKKIIHLLCVYGMTKDDGNGDLDRMDEFVMNIGARNPKKKKLFYLSIHETLQVLNQVEQMVKKELKQ
jgi:hypothetical protein